jgi:uncharacterized Zn-binding protein involved in type VI secretion
VAPPSARANCARPVVGAQGELLEAAYFCRAKPAYFKEALQDSAATVGSKAQNMPPHLPAGGPFLRPPKNQATIQQGSERVIIGNKGAARSGDPAITCNDPADAPNGVVVATGRVLIG